ncbi:MAG: DUF4350 domain-containing protein, partial [Cellulomonadaceae bacterium]|nr:DUF4350 domain-containing protein [Cellulomonadaceae bacterium]
EPLAPDNPEAAGAMAVAQILGDQGVEVEYVRTTAQAVAAADAGTTLLVMGTFLLTDEQVSSLAGTDADLVLVSPEPWHVGPLTDWTLDSTSNAPADSVEPACTDPDAQAAGPIANRGFGFRATGDDAVVCYPTSSDPLTGAYATTTAGGRRVVLIDDARILSNARLEQDGNASLALRSLGRHEHLTWYLPTRNDPGAAGQAAPGAGILPDWTRPLAFQLALVALALALWRGRALGRVVTEPLPVTVRAAETTLGRGRLYRRSRSSGHAAAALRAGTARRCAARLGLPRTAGAVDVIDALARATGRTAEQVESLLYGPPPTDDVGLLTLARMLDQLESEVHRT